MTLAHIYAASSATLVTLIILMVVSRLGLKHAPTHTIAPVLATTFVTLIMLHPWRASSRAPRTTLGSAERFAVATSGCIVGFFGFALVLAAIVG